MVQIKGMSKPNYCDECKMVQLVGSSWEKPYKCARCSILKRMFDVNLLEEGAHQPVPDDCPITEVEE